jgi:hypothetical protein
MSNIVEKISGRERHVKLGIISVETMTRGRFRNDLIEWSSIEDKETRSKNRSLRNPTQQLKNGGFSAS